MGFTLTQLLVTDFGLSHTYVGMLKESSSSRDVQSTTAQFNQRPALVSDADDSIVVPSWLAPEVLREQPYTEKAECYAMGIVMSEIIAHELPFHAEEFQFMHQVETLVKQGQRPLIPPDVVLLANEGSHSSCSDCTAIVVHKYVSLMTRCWDDNACCRPSFGQQSGELQAMLDLLSGHVTVPSIAGKKDEERE